MLTIHGALRANERAAISDPEHMDRLWSVGRPAVEADFLAFCSWPREGSVYRIVVFHGNTLMLARGYNGDLITVMKK